MLPSPVAVTVPSASDRKHDPLCWSLSSEPPASRKGLWIKGSQELHYITRDGSPAAASARLTTGTTLIWGTRLVALRQEGNLSKSAAALIAVRLPAEDFEDIERIAARAKVPVGALIRGWVLAELAAERGTSLRDVIDHLAEEAQRLRRLAAVSDVA